MADLAVRASDALEQQAGRSRELRTRERSLYRAAAVTVIAAPVLVVIGTILIVTGVAAGGALLTAAACWAAPRRELPDAEEQARQLRALVGPLAIMSEQAKALPAAPA